MKLYLASFMQRDNFGPGRVISITDGGKPNGIIVPFQFKPFTPPKSLILKYNEMKVVNAKEASKFFLSSYNNQLSEFYDELKESCKKESKTVQELLPFEDGDTLASWERFENYHYRDVLYEFIKDDYEVNLR